MNINAIKQLIPRQWHSIAKKVYYTPLFLRESFGPFERQMNYKGFTLHYTRGTSLIRRIFNGRTYEPDLTWKILETLKKFDNPVFLDIGANIGLISLNMLAALPNTHIYAFEPGYHQYALFKQTISDNAIDSHITLYNEALGSKIGEINFVIHSTKHVSGDGFIDTGRSGKTKNVKVPVNTLDHWRYTTNKPYINVVKIDVEGAELWILEGAVEFLAVERPVVFLEISKENLKVYPYGADDIVVFFEQHGYKLQTLAGSQVRKNTIQEVIEFTQDFMALPDETTVSNEGLLQRRA